MAGMGHDFERSETDQAVQRHLDRKHPAGNLVQRLQHGDDGIACRRRSGFASRCRCRRRGQVIGLPDRGHWYQQRQADAGGERSNSIHGPAAPALFRRLLVEH